MNQTQLTKNLLAAVDAHPNQELYDWLPQDADKSLCICVGAGPWRINRRKKVQGDALNELARKSGKIHKFLAGDTIWSYPFDWQKNIIRHVRYELMMAFLLSTEKGLQDYSSHIIALAKSEPIKALEQLYWLCHVPAGTKVISLFARDYLKIPSFPIDRHVKRILKQYNLPTRENELVALCLDAGLDPRRVATSFVRGGLDKGNPDWRDA